MYILNKVDQYLKWKAQPDNKTPLVEVVSKHLY